MDNFIYEMIKRLGVFTIIAQTMIHFCPNTQYEKYIKVLIGIMSVTIVVTPFLGLMKGFTQAEFIATVRLWEDKLMESGEDSEIKSLNENLENAVLKVEEELDQSNESIGTKEDIQQTNESDGIMMKEIELSDQSDDNLKGEKTLDQSVEFNEIVNTEREIKTRINKMTSDEKYKVDKVTIVGEDEMQMLLITLTGKSDGEILIEEISIEEAKIEEANVEEKQLTEAEKEKWKKICESCLGIDAIYLEVEFS